MPLLIEMVVDLGVNRAELLQRLRTSKPLHRPLSSSKRLVRILRPIVEAAPDLVPIGVAQLFHRCGIGAKPVGDDLPRLAVPLHDPLEKLQRRSLVPSCRDHSLQDLAFMVDGAPEIAELAVDLHKDLIQTPAPLRIAAHMRDASLADLGGERWAKPVPPEPDGLMADVDPALGQQILDVARPTPRASEPLQCTPGETRSFAISSRWRQLLSVALRLG